MDEFRSFLKYRVWEFILCLCAAWGISIHVMSGFIMDDALSSNPFYILLLLAVVMAAMVLFSWNRLMTGLGIALGVVLIVLFLLYTRTHDVIGDESANSFIIALAVTLGTGVLVWLASRTKAGMIALFLVSNFVMVSCQFLHWGAPAWSFFLPLAAMALLFLWRTYMKTLIRVTHGDVAVGRFLLQALLITILAFVIGTGVYGTVVRPLEPPTRQLELVQRLKNMDILKLAGIYTVVTRLEPDLAKAQQQNMPEASSEEADSENPEIEGGDNGTPDMNKDAEDDIYQSPFLEAAQNIHYNLEIFRIPWTYIIIGCLVAAAFLLRWQIKKRWRGIVEGLSPELRVVNYYRYFLTRLKRAGHKREENQTLLQYAADMEYPLEEYAVGEISFPVLTDIYVNVCYGRNRVSEEEAAMFSAFYDTFHKALRRDMGILKYLLKIFRM